MENAKFIFAKSIVCKIKLCYTMLINHEEV